MLPFVSVITPIFQTHPQYVRECVLSVRNQTYPKERTEHILYLNESGETYRKELDRAVSVQSDDRISLLSGKENLGVSGARNAAIDCCHGDWLLMLDSDDVIEKTAISSLVKSVCPDTVMVYSDHAKVTNDLRNVIYIRKKAIYHHLLGVFKKSPVYNPIYSSVFISPVEFVRRDVMKEMGGYQKSIGEKPPLWIGIFERFGYESMNHIPRVLYYYRENKDGICSTRFLELIRSHEETFLKSIKRHTDSISKVKFLGTISPFMVKHFAFYDNSDLMIRMPYIDYRNMKLVNTLHSR